MSARPVYAPALVAWVGGPRFNLSISVGGGGGVAWFPLGPREVYVPGYHASPAYVRRVNTMNTTITNINITNVRYVNQTAPGAVTAVSRETFVNARPVGRAAIPVQAGQLQNAEVVRTAAYAPSRESVLGRSTVSPSPRPPEAVLNRSVVVKSAPPPAPVPFTQRQQALARESRSAVGSCSRIENPLQPDPAHSPANTAGFRNSAESASEHGTVSAGQTRLSGTTGVSGCTGLSGTTSLSRATRLSRRHAEQHLPTPTEHPPTSQSAGPGAD